MLMHSPSFVSDICEILAYSVRIYEWALKQKNLLLNIHAQSHFDNQSLRWLKYNFCEMVASHLGNYYKKNLQTWLSHNRALLPASLSYGFINLCL